MSDNCPEVDIGVARNGEYWKRVGPRERQAAYRDWLDRERERAALAGAACNKCVFWLDEAPESGDAGICRHSWGKVSGGEHLMKLRTRRPHLAVFGVRTGGGDWCEHYLPRAVHDPRPEGGTP